MNGQSDDRPSEILNVFYRVPRAGAERLSDGGGPFGFDIILALIVDDLVTAYRCDAIVETGCHLGDTTAYLAAAYPQLPVFTCDTDPSYAAFTRHRLRDHGNVTVTCQDSPELVAQAVAGYDRPLFFLDAHWGGDWPLLRELEVVQAGAGVVVIDDFDIGHPRFAWDEYEGVRCGPDLLARLSEPPAVYFTPDPGADHPLPCLQTGRRAGTGVVLIGLDAEPLHAYPHLINRRLAAETTDRTVSA